MAVMEQDPNPGGVANAKRTLTRDNVVKTTTDVVVSVPILVRALVRPKIPRALREKIMLEVTAVNDCRYCQWGHTHLAIAQGVPLEEINQIFGHQNETLAARNTAEAAAILFAQHYADSLGRFDPESIQNLRAFYSDAQVAEILAYLRAITLGNLTGNTLDALLDRFRRHGHAERGRNRGSWMRRRPSRSRATRSDGVDGTDWSATSTTSERPQEDDNRPPSRVRHKG